MFKGVRIGSNDADTGIVRPSEPEGKSDSPQAATNNPVQTTHQLRQTTQRFGKLFAGDVATR